MFGQNFNAMKKYVIIAAAAIFVVGCKDVKKSEQEVVAKDSLSLPKDETADEVAGASGTAKIDASVALKFINDYVAQQDKLNGIEAHRGMGGGESGCYGKVHNGGAPGN